MIVQKHDAKLFPPSFLQALFACPGQLWDVQRGPAPPTAPQRWPPPLQPHVAGQDLPAEGHQGGAAGYKSKVGRSPSFSFSPLPSALDVTRASRLANSDRLLQPESAHVSHFQTTKQWFISVWLLSSDAKASVQCDENVLFTAPHYSLR